MNTPFDKEPYPTGSTPLPTSDVDRILGELAKLQEQHAALEAQVSTLKDANGSNGATSGSSSGATSPGDTPKTARARLANPSLEYVKASVAFATTYLALDPRRRRGLAHALPFIPAAIAMVDAVKSRRLDGDALLPVGVPAAGGVAALLIGNARR